MGNQPSNSNAGKNSQPTDPMKKAGDVQNSNDENIDKDFPGYPHYPATEDIMQPGNHTERVTADVDGVSKADLNYMHLNNPDPAAAETAAPSGLEDEDELGIVQGTEADVTDEDRELLRAADRDMDLGEAGSGMDPRFGSQRDTDDIEPVDEHLDKVHDADLDVPGEELDDTNENIGEEDEENNYYSLGGDAKD